MKEKDLSPEQRVAFKNALLDCKYNVRIILAEHLVLLIILCIANYLVFKYVSHDQTFKFILSFFTTILVVGSANKSLIEESDSFREEANKILKK